ncbi:hypothetical protein CAPTEDRAFT_182747 [Capitella teleta]|uniref:Signal peptidase complex subunit 1 n=1 Tax=Capitella teleta TaxID=283909 RepID=R7UNQ8_CAPTE|nr:hypothetical protein CAPTEDRAFT_182747 [Capitella teleta]|eukprot:ELU05542.1 hypothetical protein CAPTEDRAFT_182747 [Capitella teleta]
MNVLLDLLPSSVKNLPTFMDFEGQKRAERTFQVIIVLFAAVGFVWGYICQQFSQTIYILAAGFLLSCLLTLPPWPMYRLKPLQWQKARVEPTEAEVTAPPSGSKSNKKKK